ncbi:MAG: tetratricopeptide repeat protein [Lentisphaeria bacterium]|nr:tetratricopeptide repeat protein [Lentisphaeria bacterium]
MRNTFLRTVAGAFEGMHPVLIPLFALLVGCCMRGLYLYELSLLPVGGTIVGPDVSEYYSWACRILAGEVFPVSVPIHAPLYAYFLAILAAFCSHQVLAMRFLQSILMMTLTVYPVYYSLRVIYFAPENQTTGRVWTMRFIPFVSSWILALYPPLAVYQAEFFSENLVCVFFAFAIYFMLVADKSALPARLGYFAVAGLFCAFAVLTHPSSVLFALFVFLYLLIRGVLGRGIVVRDRKVFTAFVFILPVVLLVLAWSCPVSRLASRPVFVQGHGGFNFYLGNRDGAKGTCDIPPGKEWYKVHADNSLQAEKMHVSSDGLFVKKAVKTFFRSPLEGIVRIGRKFLFIFSASELSTWSDITPLGKSFFHRNLFHYFFLFLSLTAGMVFFSRLSEGRFIHDMRYFLLLGLAVILAQLLTVSAGRYRLGLILPLTAMSSIFFAASGKTVGKYWRAGAALVLFFLLGLGGMILDLREREKDLEDYARVLLAEAHLKKGEPRKTLDVLRPGGKVLRDSRFSSLESDLAAKALLAEKDPSGAEKVLKEALKKDPEDFALLMNYGTVLLDAKKWKEAKEAFDRASLVPSARRNMADLEYNYGLLAQRTGKFSEAERRYHVALQLDPLAPAALNNLGVLLIQAGKAEQAEIFLRRACAVAPGSEPYLVNLAVALKILGKQQAMEKTCRKALFLNPNSRAILLLKREKDR